MVKWPLNAQLSTLKWTNEHRNQETPERKLDPGRLWGREGFSRMPPAGKTQPTSHRSVDAAGAAPLTQPVVSDASRSSHLTKSAWTIVPAPAFPAMISSPLSSSLAGHPILLAGLLLLAANASAQAPASGTIEGRVSNPRTGEYLENARLSIAGTTLETFTDLDGSYRLINVPAGSARVSVFFTGLAPQTAVVNVPPGGITTRDFTLAQPEPAHGATREAEVVKLDEFVVAVSREMEASALAINEQRFAPNIRTVASTDEFGSVAESNVGEFLKFMPGISIDYNAGNPREVSISGVPNGNVPITIDGFDVASTRGRRHRPRGRPRLSGD